MFKEFKKFVARGNVIDLAVGIIIGGAFGKVVSSLVNDIIMPPIGLLLGKVDFTNLFIRMTGSHFKSLSEAKAAGAATLNYGIFLNTIIDFLIVSLAVFVLIRQINRLKREPAPLPAPEVKECPYCLSSIPLKATRCGHCTSQLDR